MSIVKTDNKFGSLVQNNNYQTLDLYQKSKRFVFVPDIEKLKQYMEQTTGLSFHYEIAKDCNYFYHFWLEAKKQQLS